jgi:hypothetical protein
MLAASDEATSGPLMPKVERMRPSSKGSSQHFRWASRHGVPQYDQVWHGGRLAAEHFGLGKTEVP